MKKIMQNRQIKFRIYNKRTNQWIHGPGEEVSLFGEMILLGGFLKGVSIQDLEHCVALQFTGMLDKNGNEIYDGDVIKDSWRENQPYGYSPDEEYNKEDVFIVEYKDYSFNLEEKRSRSQTCIEGFYREVIGNIFDNAELVKQ